MKNDELEPLAEDTRKWLEVERPLDAVPSEARARLLAKIAATTAAVAPASAAGAPNSAAPAASALGSKLTIAVVAFAVGGAVGAIGHAVATPPLQVPPPVVLNLAVQEPPPVVPTTPPPPKEEVTVKVPAPIPRAKPGSPDTLNAERSLIEQARTALSRQQPRAALIVLTQHEREFPSGQLAEDRIALLVVTMSTLGEATTAKRLADSFRARYPSSLLMPTVDAASPP